MLEFDVGKVDVVIFDCCIAFSNVMICVMSRLYFFMCTSKPFT